MKMYVAKLDQMVKLKEQSKSAIRTARIFYPSFVNHLCDGSSAHVLLVDPITNQHSLMC